MSPAGPFLVGESIDAVSFEFVLINFSNRDRRHYSILNLRSTGDVGTSILQPDGVGVLPSEYHFVEREPDTPSLEIRRRSCRAWGQTFYDIGYGTVTVPGHHKVGVALAIGGVTVVAPPVFFDVVDIPPRDVLSTDEVPLVGFDAAKPLADRHRKVVQQVRLGEKILLVFRDFYGSKHGGAVSHTTRIAELPGQVELRVTPPDADEKPITITYKDGGSPTGTRTLKVDYVNGRPWVEPSEYNPNPIPPPRSIKVKP
jgi:hypothetical protein